MNTYSISPQLVFTVETDGVLCAVRTQAIDKVHGHGQTDVMKRKSATKIRNKTFSSVGCQISRVHIWDTRTYSAILQYLQEFKIFGNWERKLQPFSPSGNPHSNLVCFVPTRTPDPDMQNGSRHFKYRCMRQRYLVTRLFQHQRPPADTYIILFSRAQLLNASLRHAWRHQSAGSCSALHFCIP